MKSIQTLMAVSAKTEFANGRHQVQLVCINAKGESTGDGELRVVIDNIEAFNEFAYETAYRVVFQPMEAEVPEPAAPPVSKSAKRKPARKTTSRKKARR